jgi:hypothetical protein
MKKLLTIILLSFSCSIYSQLYIGMNRTDVNNLELIQFTLTKDLNYLGQDDSTTIILTMEGDVVVAEEYIVRSSKEIAKMEKGLLNAFVPYRGNILVSIHNSLYCIKEDNTYLFTFKK